MSLSIDLSADWQSALRLLLGGGCRRLYALRARRLALLSCYGGAIYSEALRTCRNSTVPDVTTCSLPSFTSSAQRARGRPSLHDQNRLCGGRREWASTAFPARRSADPPRDEVDSPLSEDDHKYRIGEATSCQRGRGSSNSGRCQALSLFEGQALSLYRLIGVCAVISKGWEPGASWPPDCRLKPCLSNHFEEEWRQWRRVSEQGQGRLRSSDAALHSAAARCSEAVLGRLWKAPSFMMASKRSAF